MRARVLRLAIRAVSVPLVLAVGVPGSSALVGLSASDTGWRAVAIVSERSFNAALYAAAAAGPSRAWAVGAAEPASASAIHPLVESWNGTAWSTVRLPAGVVSELGLEPFLTTAAASRDSGLWAFTLTGGWLHGSGTTWTAGRLPGSPYLQASVAAGRAVWAFGAMPTASGGASPYAAHLTGKGRWKRTPVPGRDAVAAASAVSANDVWAVLGRGLIGTSVSVSGPGGLVHWTGGRWRAVPSLPAALRNSALGAVLARSDREIWVGGAVRNAADGTTETVGHWNGRRWTVTRLHAPVTSARYHVVGLAPDGAGGIWALGLRLNRGPDQRSAFRLWHESGGTWTDPIQPALASRPTVLFGLAAAGSSVWAAGVIKAGINRGSGLIALWGPTPS